MAHDQNTVSSYRKVQDVIKQIVLANVVELQDFDKLLQDLDVSSYDDLEEERYLGGTCGYPLCDNSVAQPLVQQRYAIRNNQIIELSLRRRFCSSRCFASSQRVKEQLPTEPLWITGPRKPITFHIPNVGGQGSEGLITESTSDLIAAVKELKLGTADSETLSVVGFAASKTIQPSLIEEIKSSALDESSYRQNSTRNTFDLDSVESDEGDIDDAENIYDAEVDALNGWRPKRGTPNLDKSNHDAALDEIRRKYFAVNGRGRMVPQRLSPKVIEATTLKPIVPLTRKRQDPSDLLLQVEQKVATWITPSTKIVLVDAAEYSDLSSKVKGSSQAYERKVQSFLRGELIDVHDEDEPSCEPNLPARLPLVDSRSQLAHRQTIVLECLSRCLTNQFREHNVKLSTFHNQLRALVLTFDLTASNVILDRSEWRIAGLLMLALLRPNVKAVQDVWSQVQEAFTAVCDVQSVCDLALRLV